MCAFGGKADVNGRSFAVAHNEVPQRQRWVSLIHRFQSADVFPNHPQVNFQALEINLERAGNL
jgi:hypothetical protein